MGKQTGLFKFTGKLGGVIGYRMKGEYFVRSMPEHVHQTAGTKQSSLAFGKASRLGAAMRHAIGNTLECLPTGSFGNQLNTALVGILQADDLHAHKRFTPSAFKNLKGMELNPHAALSGLLPVTPTVGRAESGHVPVTIPAMAHFSHNPQATHISIKAMALYVQSSFREAVAEASEPVLLPVDQPSAEITLMVPAAKGAVCCVLLEVNSLVEENGRMALLRNKKYTAAAVIAVLVKRGLRMKHRKRAYACQDERLAVRELPVSFFQRE